jgi:hypothetical protein
MRVESAVHPRRARKIGSGFQVMVVSSENIPEVIRPRRGEITEQTQWICGKNQWI